MRCDASTSLRSDLGIAVDFASGAIAQATSPDITLHNGKLLSVDANSSIQQAVAITGNIVAAAWSNGDITKLAGPNTAIVDRKGRKVTQGLMDAHRL